MNQSNAQHWFLVAIWRFCSEIYVRTLKVDIRISVLIFDSFGGWLLYGGNRINETSIKHISGLHCVDWSIIHWYPGCDVGCADACKIIFVYVKMQPHMQLAWNSKCVRSYNQFSQLDFDRFERFCFEARTYPVPTLKHCCSWRSAVRYHSYLWLSSFPVFALYVYINFFF